jgi:hypothetical protein
MSNFYLVPEWFFELGIGLEILFAVVSFIVSWYAFKLYKLSEQREIRLFSISFALISLSYVIKSILMLFVLSNVESGMRALNIGKLQMIGIVSVYAHIALFTLGIVTLAYMTLKKENCKAYLLLVSLTFFGIILGKDHLYAFSVISSVILLYITLNYLFEYLHNKNNKTLLIFTAFAFLFISGAGFALAPSYYLNFVFGHLIELASYLLIILSLILTIRRG